MLKSLGNIKEDRVKDTVIQGKKHDLLVTLHQEDVLICAEGASNHMTRCNDGAVNVHDMKVLSLGHSITH